MIRTSASRALLLAVATLVTGATIVNCSSKQTATSHDNLGAVGVSLTLSNGSTVNQAGYKISGNGITPVTGTVAVTDPAAKVTFFVNGIPAGKGYLVEITAASTDGKTSCAGSATFDVAALSTTQVAVALQCRTAGTTGSVSVTTTLNACPTIDSYVASPVAVSVGGSIALSATASDSDTADTLAFAWTAPAGTFSAATAASTSYTCSTGGKQTLTLTVTDSKCPTTATFEVDCVALACGNGTLDTGEECDPPSAANLCDSTCHTIPNCGNSKVERGEQCDPPDGIVCNATCQNIAISCGNSIVQPGEECDPPKAGECSAQCKKITAPVCGNGTVESGEGCEPPNTATCDAKCQTIVQTNTACKTCLDSSIATGDCEAGIGCDGLTGSDKDLCVALYDCMKTTGCWSNDPLDCLCGTAKGVSCASSAANGACKAQIQAATKTTDPVGNGTAFYSLNVPAGHATQYFACVKDFCPTDCK